MPEQKDSSQGRSWQRIGVIVGVALLALVATATYVLKGQTYVIELTEQQIQEKLDARFPMEKSHLRILVLTLSQPGVRLVEGSDRVTFGM